MTKTVIANFCRTVILYKRRVAYAVVHAVSVCLSVTFVYSVETNKHNFNIFSPS